MNFSEKLNYIIFKYDIDKPVPNYRKYIKAIELARTIYSAIKKQGEFLLLGIDEADVKAFLASVGSKDERPIQYYKEAADLQSDENALLVSYYQKDEIVAKLLEQNVKVFSLYDYFEENGIMFSHNYYDIYNEQYWDNEQGKWVYEYGNIDVNRIYFNHRRRYDMEQEPEIKKRYLEKMIFDCVYVKDFLTLKENIDEYLNVFGDQESKYTLFYHEIEVLLDELKKSLEVRNAKDCIMFWLDGLGYGLDKTMPFLNALDEKALVFNKAFPVTPYTSPTLITILTGKRQIEDETYRIKRIEASNNVLASELQARDYSLKFYGCHINHYLNKEVISSHFYRSDMYSFTQVYWDVLTDLTDDTDDTKNKFSIIHEFCHTHWPFVSFGIKGSHYITDYRDNKLTKNAVPERLKKQQQIESRNYVDRQLDFWSNLLPDNMYKIYMSDHGLNGMGSFHAIMKVQQNNIRPTVCSKVFSYTNFIPMVLQLLDNQTVDIETIAGGCALIQEVPLYNKERVLEVISGKDYYCEQNAYSGYQGIVTDEDMLVSYGNGFEYYQKHENDYRMVSDDRLNYLRGLLSRKQVDYFHIDKFRYSRILITAEQRRAERTRNLRMRKQEVISNIFGQIQDSEVFALRGGGYHTLNLLMPLKEQLRSKVKYIIDGDRDCAGGKMGIEVITLNEMLQKGVTTVLISSYHYLRAWEEELKAYDGIRIINMYRILEEHGLPCEREACFEEFIDEDFDLSLADV